MAHFNTYALKVSFRMFGKHYNQLTQEQKQQVVEFVYNNY
jgi:hypothetical protein